MKVLKNTFSFAFKKFGFAIFSLLCILLMGAGSAFATDYDLSSRKVNKIIPIAMSTDNNYVYPTIISMVSMCENKKPDTFLDFNVMVSSDVTQKARKNIKAVQYAYKNCNVTIHDMKNMFSEARTIRHLTTPAYYRLSVASLLPQYDKVLYIDGDTIVRCDLWDLYSTNINGYYVAGAKDQMFSFINNKTEYAKKLGIGSMEQYINSGVLLINTKEIRKNGIEKKFNEYIPTLKWRNLICHDQEVVNAVCYNKIKFINPLYNALQTCKDLHKRPLPKSFLVCCNKEDWKDMEKNPRIIHYNGPDKPWKTSNVPLFSEFDVYKKITAEKVFFEK